MKQNYRLVNLYGGFFLMAFLMMMSHVSAQVPVARFTTCTRIIEQYGSLQLFDSSTNSPNQWSWDVYDSTTYASQGLYPSLGNGMAYADPWSNGHNETSKNPEFGFDMPGTYTVALVSTNGNGSSIRKVLNGYIKVITTTQYYLGYGMYGPRYNNVVHSNYGTITDDGGPNLRYGNRQGTQTRSYLAIVPEWQRPVLLQFNQVRLNDAYDSIVIFDDSTRNYSKVIDVITMADNGTRPSYTSTGPAMYFFFTSDSSGTDSGYKAYYYQQGDAPGAPATFNIGHNVLRAYSTSVFFNSKKNRASDQFYNYWYADNVLQAAFNGLDTFRHVFMDTNSHRVCLVATSCNSTFTTCKNLEFDKGLIGSVYKDTNGNCVKNAGEPGISRIKVNLYNRSMQLLGSDYSDADGSYDFLVDTGKYTLKVDTTGVPFHVNCMYPGDDSTLTLTTGNPLGADINFDVACRNGYDVGVRAVAAKGVVFPGQQHAIHVNAGDLTKWYGMNCASNLSGQVKITVTGKVNYVGKTSGSLTPSVSGKIFTYTISDFANVNNSTDFGLRFGVDTNANSWDTIKVLVEVTPTGSDYNPGNNTYSFQYYVRNSLDPNLMEVSPVDIFTDYNGWFTYTIHFQNTGNAPAFNIRIADTLDTKLDMTTLEILDYSHTTSASVKENIVSFKFPYIMLPDSSSNKEGSEGFVQYRIKAKGNQQAGAKINSRAHIYFDYNQPIVTNTAVNTYISRNTSIVPVTAGKVNIYPNPGAGLYNISLSKGYAADNLKVTVYNVLGELVYSGVLAGMVNQIDLRGQPNGVYVVRIGEGASMFSAIMIKQ